MLGPNDRRLKVTRCSACVRRKVKCEGGFPCKLCIRTFKTCVPPSQPAKTGLVIVHDGRGIRAPVHVTKASVPCPVPMNLVTRLLRHFYCEYVPANDFAPSGFLDIGLVSGFASDSPSLYDAIVAIAALDASRRSHVLSSAESDAAGRMALRVYRRAVSSLQGDIQSGVILKTDAGLWCTLYLGIFELMYDTTGEGWMRHMLYGTSQILRIRGPAAHLRGTGRSFFLFARIFEVCRGLIYSESSFLSEPGWTSMTQQLWVGRLSDDWHPIQTLLDLMISCSSLSMRAHDLDDKAEEPAVQDLLSIANEGISLRLSLKSWFEASFPSPSTEVSELDSSSLLAKSYFHAILIFLSGIFDYRTYWNDMLTPQLHSADIPGHVSAILRCVNYALKSTRLAGVFFFFPLRVAGARCTSSGEQASILKMLKVISSRNFVVADAFIDDLSTLWVV